MSQLDLSLFFPHFFIIIGSFFLLLILLSYKIYFIQINKFFRLPAIKLEKNIDLIVESKEMLILKSIFKL